jgi:hypothetical protein
MASEPPGDEQRAEAERRRSVTIEPDEIAWSNPRLNRI